MAPNLQRLHTLWCPVYTLNSSLQAGRSIPEWNARARLGVNLGPSPKHGGQVTQQSKYNKCLYFRGNTLFEVYVDNGIFTSPNDKDTTKDMSDLRSSNCNIEDQGGIEDYLGVNVMQDLTGIHLIYPHLMDQIIKDIGINSIVLLQESLYQQHQRPSCQLIQMESPSNTTLTTDQ